MLHKSVLVSEKKTCQNISGNTMFWHSGHPVINYSNGNTIESEYSMTNVKDTSLVGTFVST